MYFSSILTNCRFLVRPYRSSFRFSLYNQATAAFCLTSHSRNFHVPSKIHNEKLNNTIFYNQRFTRPDLKPSYQRSNISECRYFATKSNDGSGDDQPAASSEDDSYNTHAQLPATVVVPEVWPHVPVIAVSRNVVFPRFIKLIEVCYIIIFKLVKFKIEYVLVNKSGINRTNQEKSKA